MLLLTPSKLIYKSLTLLFLLDTKFQYKCAHMKDMHEWSYYYLRIPGFDVRGRSEQEKAVIEEQLHAGKLLLYPLHARKTFCLRVVLMHSD